MEKIFPFCWKIIFIFSLWWIKTFLLKNHNQVSFLLLIFLLILIDNDLTVNFDFKWAWGTDRWNDLLIAEKFFLLFRCSFRFLTSRLKILNFSMFLFYNSRIFYSFLTNFYNFSLALKWVPQNEISHINFSFKMRKGYWSSWLAARVICSSEN